MRGKPSCRAETARRPSSTSLGSTPTGCGRRCSRTDVLARRFHRTLRGEIRLRLPEEEQELLRQLTAETRELIGQGEDPALRRLRPAAYENPELEREYRELTGRHLADSRDRALILVEETVGRD